MSAPYTVTGMPVQLQMLAACPQQQQRMLVACPQQQPRMLVACPQQEQHTPARPQARWVRGRWALAAAWQEHWIDIGAHPSHRISDIKHEVAWLMGTQSKAITTFANMGGIRDWYNFQPGPHAGSLSMTCTRLD